MSRHRTRYGTRATSPVISRITGPPIIVSYDRILVGTPATAHTHIQWATFTPSSITWRLSRHRCGHRLSRQPKAGDTAPTALLNARATLALPQNARFPPTAATGRLGEASPCPAHPHNMPHTSEALLPVAVDRSTVDRSHRQPSSHGGYSLRHCLPAKAAPVRRLFDRPSPSLPCSATSLTSPPPKRCAARESRVSWRPC